MRKKIWIGIGAVVVGAGIPVWLLYGRYAVEGGRASWAVINDRPDVLRAALAAGIDTKEKDDALSRAVWQSNADTVKVLLAAGANPNQSGPGQCLLSGAIVWARPATARALLEAGADPKRCENADDLIGELLSRGHDSADEAELVAIIRLLVGRGLDPAKGGRLDPPLKVADQRRLATVAAYLRDPRRAPDLGPSLTLALRGDGSKPDSGDLKKICLGEGMPSLPSYRQEPGKVSPIINFERTFENYRFPGKVLPSWWTSWDDASHIQLVACATVTEKKSVRFCRYQRIHEGLQIYDATWALAIREAKTGKVLVEKELALKASTHCPIVKFERENLARFPLYGVQLESLARPLVGADARQAAR